jgi:hypothetical protein
MTACAAPLATGAEPESLLMTRLAWSAAFLGLTVGLLGCSGHKAVNTAPAPAPHPDFTVKAGDLLAEYGANAVAADAKYKGKVLQVTGKFGTAQKAPLLGYAVQVLPEDAAAGPDITGVECFILESAQADVAKLQPGSMVTLLGTCDGQVVAQVKMSKCTLVK